VKNQVRRFSQAEYELLLGALRLRSEHMRTMSALDIGARFEAMLPGMRERLKETMQADVQLAESLRQRISNLYHHDCDWIGEGGPKWCLACSRRHEPHCPNCAGCLPEELPE
jgi:hypothetical protein